MVLVIHTEEDDTVLHIEKTVMLMLVVEVDVGGMTADVVDKLNCSSDDVQPRQVDLRSAHALTELHWHDTHVDLDSHEVDQREIVKLDADEDVTLEEVDAEVLKDSDVQGRLEESQAKVYHLDLKHTDKVLSMQETDEADPAEVEEVIEVVTAAKLITEVVTTATTTTIAAPVPKASALRRRRGKGEKEIEEEESKRKSENFEQKAAKKQKIDEETEELKTHLQIVPNDEDDVYTEATPLALKVPVVDYQIHHENSKPFYKIIRANETHQLFLSFITLLRKFDREDLEMLSKLVQERFQSSEPMNFSGDFLL
nr:hypothetical protein [Tanacetum cinerariifolium]